MSYFPFQSSAELTRLVRSTVDDLSSDRNNVLPDWARQDADHLFKKRRLIVCGSNCVSELRVLAQNAEILAIVDDFRVGQRIFGIPIIHSDVWVEHMRRDPALVTCILSPYRAGYNHFVRICQQWSLPFLGPLQIAHLLKTHKVDTRGETGDLFIYGHEFFTYTLENADPLVGIGRHFEDDYSRVTWFSLLMYRLTLNPFFLESCAVGHGSERFGLNSYSTNRQFLKFSDQEVYVDAGPCMGDTIAGFLRAVDGKFKHIYSFEPSPEHNAAIRRLLAQLQNTCLDRLADKISLIEKGVWNCDATLLFNPDRNVDDFSTGIRALTGGAHFIDAGIVGHVYDAETEARAAIKVPVTTIDGATDQDATFIKFEVEGSELPALQGASKTIERNRPQMAVSIYHKPEDYITLITFILETKQGYKLGLRQHNPRVPDATVVYCHH